MTDDVTGTLVGALRAMTETRAGRGGDPADRPAKTINEAYKETFGTLLRYCNVTQVEAVAPVWARLANCNKGEQHTVLTQESQKVCISRNLTTEIYTPVITAGLKQMVIGFQFNGHGIDDLSTGCQPFLVAYAGSNHYYRALADANVSNQLDHGDQAVSLTDYRTIREKEKVKFPRDILDVIITMERYSVLCQTLFQGTGAPNPFVEAMWHITASLKNATPFIAERYQQLTGVPGLGGTNFACIVRAIQVGVYEYLHAVRANRVAGHIGVDLPDFRSLVTDLKRGTFHQSSHWVAIPEEYLEPTPRTATGSVTTQSTAPISMISSVSGRTGVSSITAEVSRAHVSRIDNPAPDQTFTSITVRPGGS